jgi:hypothetical protein
MMTLTLFGPLEGAGLNDWTSEDGNIQFPKRVFFFKKQTMDEVRKHDCFKCNTPSSEPFRIEWYCHLGSSYHKVGEFLD